MRSGMESGMGMRLGIEIKLIVPLFKGDLGGSNLKDDRSFSVGVIDLNRPCSKRQCRDQATVEAIDRPSPVPDQSAFTKPVVHESPLRSLQLHLQCDKSPDNPPLFSPE